jgi:hypothetical protein
MPFGYVPKYFKRVFNEYKTKQVDLETGITAATGKETLHMPHLTAHPAVLCMA